jgi:hypothetical protein
MSSIEKFTASFKSLFSKTSWILWAALLLFIPISSFPLLAKYTGGANVSPLSLVPLLFLAVFWFIPFFARGGRLPLVSIPLLVFAVIAIISWLRAPFLEIFPFKSQTLTDRELRAAITLALGLGFYFIASCFPRSNKDIRSSLRWISAGAALMFIWATVQIFRLPYSFNPQPELLQKIHSFFTTTILFRDRVTGMAYEPSWLADQLTILFLPLWLASVLKGYTAFSFKLWRISVETLLLIWGILILFFSYSRIGLVAFLATIGVLVFSSSWNFVKRLAEKKHRSSRLSLRQLQWVYLIGILFLFLVIVVGVVYLAYLTNDRIQNMLTINLPSILESERLPPFYNLINHLEYAERLMYWISAFLVFSQFPFLGVGLGNAGFFFRQAVPAFGYYLPELLLILDSRRDAFANPKSLWLRLLAETGILGFLTFISFLVALALVAIWFNRHKKGLPSVLGLATGLAMVALIFEGFSLDTFALPQLWIILGLLSAALMINSKKTDRLEQAT